MKSNKLNLNKLFLNLFLVSTALIFLQGCESDDNIDQGMVDKQLIVDYLTENEIEAEETEKGYFYTVLEGNEEGAEVEDDDIVSAYYTMTLLDGTEIDSVLEVSGTPVKFKNTNEALIPIGLKFGVSKMKIGETFRFFIPSSLAFGFYSYEDLIPANAIIIVDLKVVKIETAEEQQAAEAGIIDAYILDNSIENIAPTSTGLYFKSIIEGEGDAPTDGQNVSIQYVLKDLDGEIIDSSTEDKNFNFRLGDGKVIKGLEEAIMLMKKGGKSSIIIPSDLAYAEGLQILPEAIRENLMENGLIANKPAPFSILVFEIELVNLQN
jgi:peptidylprolyl isomerase